MRGAVRHAVPAAERATFLALRAAQELDNSLETTKVKIDATQRSGEARSIDATTSSGSARLSVRGASVTVVGVMAAQCRSSEFGKRTEGRR